MSASRELVKLYYRIGEVSQIVGVQPHVLRYWETEFRTIRPQKSHKGQRVYSRKDVEKLLRVKDLLKNQGFTIAGAKRKLREPEVAGARSPQVDAAVETVTESRPEAPTAAVAVPIAAAVALPAAVPVAAAMPSHSPSSADLARAETHARVREALASIREDILAMLRERDGLDAPPRRPKLPTLP
ncbi:MAG TPA: MerR family transcriptional regulator [Polyangiaceae bacterium]|nr:MerR family transcriptional regulator [Polyangiaceae bacterium]